MTGETIRDCTSANRSISRNTELWLESLLRRASAVALRGARGKALSDWRRDDGGTNPTPPLPNAARAAARALSVCADRTASSFCACAIPADRRARSQRGRLKPTNARGYGGHLGTRTSWVHRGPLPRCSRPTHAPTCAHHRTEGFWCQHAPHLTPFESDSTLTVGHRRAVCLAPRAWSPNTSSRQLPRRNLSQ